MKPIPMSPFSSASQNESPHEKMPVQSALSSRYTEPTAAVSLILPATFNVGAMEMASMCLSVHIGLFELPDQSNFRNLVPHEVGTTRSTTQIIVRNFIKQNQFKLHTDIP